MRYSFTITALSLLSSAFAITITSPSSNTVWDFSTAKTIKFTSDSSDPPVISIILRSQDGSFQTKLADNVKTADGEYTTQPNPSISNGDNYEIQIIDSAGQLAVSNVFTVEKGASSDGTTSSSSSTSSSTTITTVTSPSTSSASSSSTSFTTSSETMSTSVTSTVTSSAYSTPTSSTGSTTTSSSSSTSSSTATATTLLSTGAASPQLSPAKGAITLLGAAFALFFV
ncbi:hypothetical protein N7523_003171 [Penicillium sp. IBT 18751x]|nr:hypothetical protein N7523_003171 [Penicillium sp. IBT 18751x]